MKGARQLRAPKSIDYIVHSAMNRLGVESDKYLDRYRIVALEYFSENLNLFHLPNISVKYYKPSASNKFQLPPDYVDYTKVGIEYNGEVWTLGLNTSMLKPQQDACGTQIGASRPKGGYVFVDHYRADGFITGLLGIGGGWNVSYFSVDRESNTLSLQGSLPKKTIILEYISSGVRMDGTTMVPLEAVDSIRQEIMFVHMASHKDTYGSYEITRQEKRVKEAELLLDRFLTTPTISELMDVFYKSYHQGVKR